MKMVIMCLAGLLVAAPLASQEPVARERPQEQDQPQEQERRHVVRRGDTLWDLANHYFNNPWRWPVIYQRNTDVVEDPHWIYPAEVLVIPGLMASVGPPARQDVALQPIDRPTRTVFYREPQRRSATPTMLVEGEADVVAVRPGTFHSAEFLADPARLPIQGRVIRPARSIDWAGMSTRPTAHPHDVVYLSYAGYRPAEGDRLMVVGVERRVHSAGRDVRLVRPTALVRITTLRPDVMEAVIESQFATVHPDQVVVPMGMYPDLLEPEATLLDAPDIEGTLLEFVLDQPLPGLADRAFIDRGSAHGVGVGDVFAAYLPERRTEPRSILGGGRSEYLPAEEVALLRVIRVSDRTATVQVENVRLPVLEDGIRVRRIRRMP